MTDFIIKKIPYDLSSHAGLALVGQYHKRINFSALVDPKFPVRSGVANSCILRSYLGLLCLGKNDFDAIEGFRTDAFFQRSLGLQTVLSSPTLRQRINAHAANWFDLATQLDTALLTGRINGKPIDFGQLPGESDARSASRKAWSPVVHLAPIRTPTSLTTARTSSASARPASMQGTGAIKKPCTTAWPQRSTSTSLTGRTDSPPQMKRAARCGPLFCEELTPFIRWRTSDSSSSSHRTQHHR